MKKVDTKQLTKLQQIMKATGLSVASASRIRGGKQHVMVPKHAIKIAAILGGKAHSYLDERMWPALNAILNNKRRKSA